MTQSKPPKSPESSDPLARLERPRIRWKILLQVLGGFAVVWLTSFMLVPYIGYWGLGVSGILTCAAAGVGIYLWRLTRKSAAIVDILKGATDEKGRKEALARLEEQGSSKDAMNALARAQLLAREKPAEAIAVLEGVDMKGAPAPVQNDVRANLALLYLIMNRVREARVLADEMKLDKSPLAGAKALYAAVMAEAFARTGKVSEAKALLETFSPADPDYRDVRAILLRAQVYTYMGSKNRGLARRALEQLVEVEPNMVASFVQKGTPPELYKLAREFLGRAGLRPKPKIRMRTQ